jgi:excinuclease UvrABC ATPase subunit
VEAVDERLVVADPKYGIRDDRLLTKQASEVLRAARRRQMLPAIDRLAEAGLVDLTTPVQAMSAEARCAYWFGFPEKSFLSAGGDESRKGDWYQWLGLANYVTANMWKAPDRDWANEVDASRRLSACPRCDGTGLGWEARMREVGGTTLQSVLTEWTVRRLATWLRGLDCVTNEGRSAAAEARERAEEADRLGLGELLCRARYPSLSPENRFRAFMVAAARNQLLGATAYVRPPAGVSLNAERLVTALRDTGNMEWVIEADDDDVHTSSGRPGPLARQLR